MKVIGIGLPRTGNTSLTKFLQLNGFKTVQYHMQTWLTEKWDSVDAIVDFPMQIMAPWILDTTDCLAIMTVREDVEALYASTLRWADLLLKSPPPHELEMVHMLIYGKLIPTLADIQAARDRRDRMMQLYVEAGRVLRLEVTSLTKAEDVCKFLGIKNTGIAYPHENRT